jgi:gliding motility-associated-like protein
VQLVQAPPFSASLDFDPPLPCEADSFIVELNYTGLGEDSLLWSMGDGSTFTTDSVFYLYSDPGTYTISLVAYNFLCNDETISSDVEFIEVTETTGFIPNVFTPNGDGMNDELEFVGIDQTAEYSIKIFNRWGKMVYEGTDAMAHWDGTGHNNGVYFYELRYTDICSEEERLVTGYVTLFK